MITRQELEEKYKSFIDSIGDFDKPHELQSLTNFFLAYADEYAKLKCFEQKQICAFYADTGGYESVKKDTILECDSPFEEKDFKYNYSALNQ